jgi:nucleoside-diphosphate-sugar epimerase
MKALISGSNGLIGSAFLNKYGYKFDEVFTIGRKHHNNLNHIHCDLSNPQNITIPEFDVFFHFASQTSLQNSRDDVLNDLKTNVLGFVNLLEIIKKLPSRPIVILASTATQVGYTNNLKAHKVSATDNPITFYDLSKLTAEKYLLRYVEENWLRGCSLRLCNVFGGSKEYGAQDRGIIDKVFMKAVDGKKITLFGEGNFSRDYIYIEDVIDAFWNAFLKIENTNNKVYYIGSGTGILLKDAFLLAQKVASEVNSNQQPISIASPPSNASVMDSRGFVSNNKNFIKDSNWVPKYNLEEGLRHCYKKLLSVKK